MSSFDNDNLNSGYSDNADASRRDENDSYGSHDRQGATTLDSSDRSYGSSGRDSNNNINLDSHESSGAEAAYDTSGDGSTYGSRRQTDSSYGSSGPERATLGSSTRPRRDRDDAYGDENTTADDDGDDDDDKDEGHGGSSRAADGPKPGSRSDAETYGASSGGGTGGHAGARNPDRGGPVAKLVQKAEALIHHGAAAGEGRETREPKGLGAGEEY